MIEPVDAILILVLLVALASGRVPISTAFGGFILAVALLDRIPFREVLAMLADPATVAVICLVLFSGILARLSWLRTMLFAARPGSLRATLARFLLVTGLVSSVMPNTAVVGAFLGPAARQANVSAHQLLIPLSYMALAGGMMTQFGTSANLMLVGQAAKIGIDLGVTDFVIPGLMTFAAVLVVLVIFAPILLRERRRDADALPELFHVEARVTAGSPLAGRTLIENNLRNLGHFYVAELVSGDHVVSPVGPHQRIEEGDVLIFAGDVRFIDEISGLRGLAIEPEAQVRGQDNVYHAVVSANSALVGTTLKQIGFRGRFDASVFAIRRGDERLSGKLGQVELKGGDLLVLAAGPDFYARGDLRGNLHIVDMDVPGQMKLSTKAAVIISLVFAAFVACALTGWTDFTLAAMLLVAAGFAGKWLSLREVRRTFPFDLVVALWGSLVLGTLIARSGLDSLLATWILERTEGSAPIVILLAIFLFSWVLTELLSNTSAALAGLPIAVEIANRSGLPLDACALAVAYGASASFLVPFGYQTHLMVMSPGNYRFSDFLKLGSVVLIGYGAASVLGIWLWRM